MFETFHGLSSRHPENEVYVIEKWQVSRLSAVIPWAFPGTLPVASFKGMTHDGGGSASELHRTSLEGTYDSFDHLQLEHLLKVYIA